MRYVYVQCVAKRDEPTFLSFSHAFLNAASTEAAYAQGQHLNLPVLDGFQFANDYVVALA